MMKPFYQDALITLYYGRCEPLLASLAGSKANAIITDPPYCSGGTQREATGASPYQKYQLSGVTLKRAEFKGDNRDQRGFGKWCAFWMSEAAQCCERTAYLASFIDWRNQPSLSDAVQVAGWKYAGLLPWDKTEAVRPQKNWFRTSQAEYVVLGTLGSRGSEQKRIGPCLPGVYRQYRDAASKLHLTGKPVSVMTWLMGPLKPGNLIIDPFAGSGSTLVAAKQMGLRAIGIEQEVENCEIAAQRLTQTCTL
jgi:site-specific DNA-methyltransferase (adenine-specific)